MKHILEQYQEQLIYIFNKEQTTIGKNILVIKEDSTIIENNDFLIMRYNEDFEALLNFKIPTKNRRVKQLLSYQKSITLLEEISYGVLSFTYDTIPYSVALNHVYIDNKLYFHGAKTGFKLHACTCPVSYLVVKDLGINEAMTTHNHMSVALQGTMRLVENIDIKQKVLQTLISHLAPSNKKTVTPQMTELTAILELDIQYLIGKSHLR